MKKALNILFFVCIVAFFSSCGKDDPETPPEPPIASVPDTLKVSGQIPIVAWGNIPIEEITEVRYNEMKDAGFTHHLHKSHALDIKQKALDVAHAVGMKQIISAVRYTESTVSGFMNHPALAGYFVTDEPGMSRFTGLADSVKQIQTVDNTHFCYINLYGPRASLSRLEAPDGRTYVNTFMNTVPLQFYSYDHYPFTGDVLDVFRSDYFYEDLEIFSDEAQKAGKPFWAFAASTAISGSLPIPTTAALRLQMFSNLAYGAQGLQYFCYWIIDDQTGFYGAPIYKGNRTEVYDMVKKVNEEIKGLSGAFLGSKVVSVAHTGSSIPEGTQRLTQLPKEITAFETVGEGAVVSVLERDDMAFLVVVNRDFRKTMNLSIKCDAAATVRKVLKNGTVPKEPFYNLKTDIGPGDIAVYMWKKTGALEYKPL